MLFEERKGNESSFTYTTSRAVNGLYIWNFDKVNPLSFTVNGITYPLEPGQGFREKFSLSFNTVTVINPSSCTFLIAGLT